MIYGVELPGPPASRTVLVLNATLQVMGAIPRVIVDLWQCVDVHKNAWWWQVRHQILVVRNAPSVRRADECAQLLGEVLIAWSGRLQRIHVLHRVFAHQSIKEKVRQRRRALGMAYQVQGSLMALKLCQGMEDLVPNGEVGEVEAGYDLT